MVPEQGLEVNSGITLVGAPELISEDHPFPTMSPEFVVPIERASLCHRLSPSCHLGWSAKRGVVFHRTSFPSPEDVGGSSSGDAMAPYRTFERIAAYRRLDFLDVG